MRPAADELEAVREPFFISGDRMRNRLRSRLRSWFKDGFWFDRVQAIIDFLNRNFSLGNRFKWWLAEEDEAPPGAAEFYQSLVTTLGLIWFFLLPNIQPQALSSNLYRVVGGVVSGYFIFELFIFSLDWIFVAKPPLESHRRSLGTYLLSLIQITLYFSIFFSHAICIESYRPSLSLIFDNIKSFISLQSVQVNDSGICLAVSQFRLINGATLMAIIVASLIGVVVRAEKKPEAKDS